MSKGKKPTDKYILSVARGFRKGMLGKETPALKCYMVSAPLHSFLSFLGVDAKLINGTVFLDEANEIWGHYWVELPDGRIVDATASQFNGKGKGKLPDVYLGERPAYYHNSPLRENL